MRCRDCGQWLSDDGLLPCRACGEPHPAPRARSLHGVQVDAVHAALTFPTPREEVERLRRALAAVAAAVSLEEARALAHAALLVGGA